MSGDPGYCARRRLGDDTVCSFAGLPKDGAPVISYTRQDEAWRQVAEGIRRVVEKFNFNPLSPCVGDLFTGHASAALDEKTAFKIEELADLDE